MFTKDGICTLADILIVDSTQIDLFPYSCLTQRFVAFDATQTKERNYRNWHPNIQFFLLTIEIFGCLHKHADMFLRDYVNVI
jgi:hypothetical protein